jgi:hypothetical protein
MARNSSLCAQCRDIFEKRLERREKKEHHFNAESFLRAIEQNCWICVQTSRHLARISPEQVFKSTYDIEDTSSDGLYERVSHAGLFVTFSLIPVSRQQRSLFPTSFPSQEGMFRRRFQTPLPPKATSPNTSCGLDLARQWLDDCQHQHERCRTGWTKRFHPTRLVDVGSRDSSTWCLKTTFEPFNEPLRYFTLSHRWGSSQPLKLTSKTMDAFQRGQELSILPLTFQDAITVTRYFGERYLWIDTLCIVQDSREDWVKESALMGDIYENGVLNIAATHATGCNSGLFRVRIEAFSAYHRISPSWKFSSSPDYVLLDNDRWTNVIHENHAPLNSRGWVLQERLLSPRVLHFGDTELFWQCKAKLSSESWPTSFVSMEAVKTHLFSMRLPPDFTPRNTEGVDDTEAILNTLHLEWSKIVEHYSSCNLTKGEDKLIALSGLASRLQERLKDEYLAGMWRSCLLDSLLWVADPEFHPKRSAEYRAPSWSWASIDGPVGFWGKDWGNDNLISISDVKVFPATENRTGQVLEGYLDLHGILLRASYFGLDSDKLFTGLYLTDAPSLDSDEFEHPLSCSPDNWDKLSYEALFLLPFYCLTGASSPYFDGLVLQAQPDMPGVYTRFGHWNSSDRRLVELVGIELDSDEEESRLSEEAQKRVQKIRIV